MKRRKLKGKALIAARKSIARARAAKLAKRLATGPQVDHLKEVPLPVADKESELDFYKRLSAENSAQVRRLTDELQQHRRLSNFIDWLMRR